MTESSSSKATLPLIPTILIAVSTILGCVLVLASGYLIWRIATSDDLRASGLDEPPTAPATLFIPTFTPLPPSPTVPPTELPVPSATPAPTEAGPTSTVPPATAPAQATRIPATAVPTVTPTPVPEKINFISFSVEKSTVAVNERVWFNFSVSNPSPTDKLSFGFLGVAVLNEAGQNIFFQPSWTGSELEPLAVLNWRDGVPGIGTAGTYRLQLSICYSAVDVCNTPVGEWKLLGQPVQVIVQ